MEPLWRRFGSLVVVGHPLAPSVSHRIAWQAKSPLIRSSSECWRQSPHRRVLTRPAQTVDCGIGPSVRCRAISRLATHHLTQPVCISPQSSRKHRIRHMRSAFDMIPDFASWTDHSNPEQGRPAGLLLDLERLRREYAEPELRFKRAMRGLDPDDDTSQTTTRPLSECLTMAVDREDYEMAVATCSARERYALNPLRVSKARQSQASMKDSRRTTIFCCFASLCSLRELSSEPPSFKVFDARLSAGPSVTASRLFSSKASKVRSLPARRPCGLLTILRRSLGSLATP